jgi:predicted PurR-regulated permease PerM
VADHGAAGRTSFAEQIELALPTGSRSRRFAQAGVVVWAAIGVALLIGVLFLLLVRLSGLLPYLVVAGMVLLILSPVVRGLERLHVPRQIGATATFAAAAVAVPALIPVLVRAFVNQLTTLLKNAPQALQHGGLVQNLIASNNSLLQSIGRNVRNWVDQHQSKAGEYLGNLAVGLTRASVVILLGGVLGYLLLLSRPQFGRFTLLLVPPQRRQSVQDVLDEMNRIVGGYVRARFLVSAVVGLIATVGLLVVGMPAPLVLGFWVGLANLIPTFGAYIGAAPVVVVALLSKPPQYVLLALLVVTLSHVVDGFFLSPLVMRETTNLHPVVVLLVVIVGAEIAGLYGVIAAIPVAGISAFFVRRWLKPRLYGPEPMAPVPIAPGALPEDPIGEVAAESGPPDDPDSA